MRYLRFSLAMLALIAACTGDASSGPPDDGPNDSDDSDDSAGAAPRSDAGSRSTTSSPARDSGASTASRTDAGRIGAGSDASVPQELCEQLQNAGSMQLQAVQTGCSSDRDCTPVSFDAPCIRAFACPTAVLATAPVDRLKDQARSLAGGYPAGCPCAVAKCAALDAVRAVCDAQTKTCTSELGAGGADAGGAGSGGTDAGRVPTLDAGR